MSRKAVLPVLALGALLAVAFWPVAAGKQTFFAAIPGTLSPPPPASAPFLIDPQDSVWQCYPWARLVHESWAAGRLPAWTPRTGMGEPLAPSTIGAVTSPLRWWTALAEPTARRWDLFLLSRLWLTAALAWGWATALGLPPLGAFAVSVGWTLSGHVVRNLNQAFLDADILLPGLAWAAWRFAADPSARGWAALAAFGGAIALGGNPQPAILAAGFAAALLVSGFAGPRSRGMRAPAAAAGAILGAGAAALAVAAPFLLPFVAAWPHMQQVHAGQGTVTEPIAGAVSLVAPWLLGRFGEPWLGHPAVRFLAWLGISAVILAAVGIRSAWAHPAGRVAAVAPAILLAAAYGIPPVSWLRGLPPLSMIWWSKYQGVTTLGVATLAGFGAAAIRRPGWRIAGPLVLLLELAWLMPRDRPAAFDPVRPGPAIRWLAERCDPREERAWAFGRTPMPQPLAAAGIPDVRTYYGFYPRRAYWWMRGLVTGPAPDSNDAVFTGSSRPLARTAPAALSAAAVRWIVSPGPLRDPAPGWVLRARLDRCIYENTRALSRAWVAGRAVRAASPEAALWEVSGDPAARDAVVVEGPADWIGFRSAGRSRSARIVEDSGDALAVEVPGEGMRVVVVADTYARGWKAFAGGKRIRILPADCAFRAVAVPPGASRVEFRFDPLPLKAGVRLFGLGLGVILGVGLMPPFRRRRARRPR